MDGIIVINKPLGYTSRDIVNIVSKQLKTKKVGHTGTLDPKASGVMVLCVGKALKICELLTDHDKEYIAQVILGIETDTLDTDINATITKQVDVNINKDEIEKVIKSFKGKYIQVVPIYSSVKVNGRKLYEYARSNTPVILPKKEVEIKDIELNSKILFKDKKAYFEIKTTVSKGTYIRALIRDIGKKLNYPSVMDGLVRIRLGNFNIEGSNTLNDIKSNNFKLHKITEVFPNIPVITVGDGVAFKIRNGVIMDNLFEADMAFITDNDNNLLALYKKENGKCKPYKMFT